jgi:hypothetical protein
MTQHSQIKADPLTIARLLQDEQGNAPKGLPPVQQWQPPFCGDIDMHIKANGQWLYQGTPILRHTLVKLFSSILRKEEGEFYLVTPVEKVRIQVEDAPLVASQVEKIEDQGICYLRFKTLTDDVVIMDDRHFLQVNYDSLGEPRPYLRVREQLDALLTRNVFYQLVNWAEIKQINDKDYYAVQSAGQWFCLAAVEA